MENEALWTQISQILRDFLPPEASVAVANDHQYLDYSPGAYDIHIEPGTTLPQGSIALQVVTQKTNVCAMMDASLFGVPYFGRGYPFRFEDTWGAVTVIYPPNSTGSNGVAGVEEVVVRSQSRHLLSVPRIFGGSGAPVSFITGQEGDVWRPIPVDEVAYFESYNKRNWMHTDSDVYTTIHTLQSLEQMLPPTFVRIHRSYIVNIEMIDHIARELSTPLSVTLATCARQKLPVSQSYVREIREKLGF